MGVVLTPLGVLETPQKEWVSSKQPTKGVPEHPTFTVWVISAPDIAL